MIAITKLTNGMKNKITPPARSTHDLAPNVYVIDGNKAGPTRLTRFGEDLPHRRNHQDDDCQPDDREDRTDSWSGAGGRFRFRRDLREQVGFHPDGQ